jgi:D-glycerate 3-kinase
MKPTDAIEDLLRQESLPEGVVAAAPRLHIPLALHLAQRARAQGRQLMVGLCGAQGSGKSTTAHLLTRLLAIHGLSALAISIDDFYFTREQRAALSHSVHPLFKTRGVPGTHDVPLAIATLQSLRAGLPTSIPRFDKAADQRLPQQTWPRVQSGVDLIILEGWCVGARPQSTLALQVPVNSLERDFDSAAIWRTHSNDALAHDYQQLFGMLDLLILLAAPSFDVVFGWRLEQEQQLRRRVQSSGGNPALVMDDVQIRWFVAHYERLTRHILQEMPQRADIVVPLDAQRRASLPWEP